MEGVIAVGMGAACNIGRAVAMGAFRAAAIWKRSGRLPKRFSAVATLASAIGGTCEGGCPGSMALAVLGGCPGSMALAVLGGCAGSMALAVLAGTPGHQAGGLAAGGCVGWGAKRLLPNFVAMVFSYFSLRSAGTYPPSFAQFAAFSRKIACSLATFMASSLV